MLGDGIRRNIATVSKQEWDQFVAAIKKLNDGSLTYSDGRTFFQKQEWVHWAGHDFAHEVGGGVAFMAWHRELCNRFEAVLRVADPQLSLHYWDWTTDPRGVTDSDGRPLIGKAGTPGLMGDDGSSGIWTALSEGAATNPDWGGEVGPPFDNFQTIVSGQPYPELGNNPPPVIPGEQLSDLANHKLTWRGVGPNATTPPLKGQGLKPPQSKPVGANAGGPKLDALGSLTNSKAQTGVAHDQDVVTAADGQSQAQQFQTFMGGLGEHSYIHQYISGTMGTEHVSLGDPFFFLIHSNLDRLWAKWQLTRMHSNTPNARDGWGIDPSQMYGSLATTDPSLNPPLSMPPWDGTAGPFLAGPLVPWVPGSHADDAVSDGLINSATGLIPNHAIVSKNGFDPTIIVPACYDTNPTLVYVDPVAHPVGSPGDTPKINFNDVPEGETALRAAVFDVHTCNSNATLVVSAGPTAQYSTFLVPPPVTPNPANPLQQVRVWFAFTGTTAGTIAPVGSVTIHCNETNQDFVFSLTGNTIARPSVAVMMTLDQSGSMDDPAGTTGLKRIDVLHSAGELFTQLIQKNNGVGLVRFDTVAYATNDPTFPGLDVVKIGSDAINDPNRVLAFNAVQAHKTNPAGNTSIGDGVQLARNTLSPVAGYDDKAILVFTDGLENTSPMIADVMGSIDNRTFAIGLGNAQQVSTAALTALTNGTGGFLLLTDTLTANTDSFFLTSKYFLQILAGVTNTNIVLDPTGTIAPGAVVQVPFVLSDADIDCTAILLTDIPAIRFFVQTPGGDIINPTVAAGIGAEYNVGSNLVYYRFTLPVPLGGGAQAGTWKALLEVDEKLFRRYCEESDNLAAAVARGTCQGVRYSVTIQAWSNVRMKARLYQNSLEPGATMTLRAILTEYDQPVDHRATVRAEVTLPDGTGTTLSLAEGAPGVFEVATTAVIPGVYRFRVLASGFTLRRTPFACEQTLTGAAFPGGDNPLPTTAPSGDGAARLCCLAESLLGDPGVERFLKERGINAKELTHRVRKCCARPRHLLK